MNDKGEVLRRTLKELSHRTRKHKATASKQSQLVIQDLLRQVLGGVFLRPEILDLVFPIFNQRKAKYTSSSPEMHSAKGRQFSASAEIFTLQRLCCRHAIACFELRLFLLCTKETILCWCIHCSVVANNSSNLDSVLTCILKKSLQA